MTVVKSVKINEGTWKLVNEYREDLGMSWDEFLKDCFTCSTNYKREKAAMDRKQKSLSEITMDAEERRKRILETIPEDILADRERWKKRAEDAEKKLKDIENLTMR